MSESQRVEVRVDSIEDIPQAVADVVKDLNFVTPKRPPAVDAVDPQGQSDLRLSTRVPTSSSSENSPEVRAGASPGHFEMDDKALKLQCVMAATALEDVRTPNMGWSMAITQAAELLREMAEGASPGPHPRLTCESDCNPYVAQCGAKFCSEEAMELHNEECSERRRDESR